MILVFASLGFLLVHLFHSSYDAKLSSHIEKRPLWSLHWQW
ncbi:hypothetical protein PO124_09350 [Bacillus licheniformis]|nr:hypothetical protein [Bacillus licheniformis]